MPISPKSNTSADFSRTEIELADAVNKIAKLATAQAAGTGTGATAQIGICSPLFIISSVQSKKGERDVMCFDPIPSAATQLEIVIGQVADQTTKSKTITKFVDVDDLAASAHHLEVEFPHELFYNTQYGLIKIKAFNTNGTIIAVNPGTNPWNGTQYTYITTWTTGNALNAPGTPDCVNDIIANVITVDKDAEHARVTFRVWADPTHSLTFAAQQALRVIVRLILDGDTKPTNFPHELSDADLASTSCQFSVQLQLGLQPNWFQNVIAHGTGRSFSATSACTFVAGGVDVSAADFATMVNNATITFTPVDGKHSLASVNYTQPSPTAFAIRVIHLRRSDDGGVTFNQDVADSRPIGEEVITPGPHSFTQLVKTKSANSHLWKARFHARGGLFGDTSAFTSTGIADATGDVGPAGVVQNFTATWEAANVTFHWKRPTFQASSVQNYNLWISDTTNSQFMQVLSDSVTKAGAIVIGKAGSVIQCSHTVLAKYKKATLAAPFATTFRVHVTANNIVNAVITEGSELTADVIVGVDYLNSTDAVNVLDVNTTMITPQQLLFNGDMLYDAGPPDVAGQLGSWLNGFLGSAITTGTSGVTWNQTAHTIDISTGAFTRITQRMRRRMSSRGDFFAISFLVSSTGTGPISVTIDFFDENTSADDIALPPVISFNGSGVFTCYGAPFQLSTSLNTANNHSMSLGISNSSGGTMSLGRIMLVRGKSPTSFAPRTQQYELNGANTSENPDISSPGQGPAGGGDASLITQGSQGGWFVPGAGIGGRIGVQ